MKKLLIVLCAFGLVLGMSLSAQAWLITFDEDGIDLGETITTQYFATLGVTWNASYSNEVTQGSDFNNPFSSDGQILYYDTKPAQGVIALAVDETTLRFDFRRPADAGDIYLELYLDGGLVHDFGRIGWDPDPQDWWTFTYFGEYGAYDQINMYSSNKFVIDNIGTVPLPASVVLLASGLGLFPLLRRRIGKGTIS